MIFPLRMNLSVFDIFKIGVGPSSSHTVGPMKAAQLFTDEIKSEKIQRIWVSLHGSLAFTGRGHGTDKAIVWGLLGHTPEHIDANIMYELLDQVKESQKIKLPQSQVEVSFDFKKDILFDRKNELPLHSNGMRFFAQTSSTVIQKTYYSVGGGFIVDDQGKSLEVPSQDSSNKMESAIPRHQFTTGLELLNLCSNTKKSISQVALENESQYSSKEQVGLHLEKIFCSMEDCIDRGLNQQGTLPGPLKVRRRAYELHQKLLKKSDSNDPLEILDWVNLYAMAVNEENAAGSKVVTAPTNGAAGIIPAVLRYYMKFRGGTLEGVQKFLLTSGVIGILYKQNASLSGAEVGCQGEVGVACSMAAAGLTEALGGSPAQVEEAAEIGMEHNLGLTCDPVGGLVQIPCIERNVMGAVKAINAARIALKGDGSHHVSLDSVMKTMRETGEDMQSKYKETSEGGLAVNITEC